MKKTLILLSAVAALGLVACRTLTGGGYEVKASATVESASGFAAQIDDRGTTVTYNGAFIHYRPHRLLGRGQLEK